MNICYFDFWDVVATIRAGGDRGVPGAWKKSRVCRPAELLVYRPARRTRARTTGGDQRTAASAEYGGRKAILAALHVIHSVLRAGEDEVTSQMTVHPDRLLQVVVDKRALIEH